MRKELTLFIKKPLTKFKLTCVHSLRTQVVTLVRMIAKNGQKANKIFIKLKSKRLKHPNYKTLPFLQKDWLIVELNT